MWGRIAQLVEQLISVQVVRQAIGMSAGLWLSSAIVKEGVAVVIQAMMEECKAVGQH